MQQVLQRQITKKHITCNFSGNAIFGTINLVTHVSLSHYSQIQVYSSLSQNIKHKTFYILANDTLYLRGIYKISFQEGIEWEHIKYNRGMEIESPAGTRGKAPGQEG